MRRKPSDQLVEDAMAAAGYNCFAINRVGKSSCGLVWHGVIAARYCEFGSMGALHEGCILTFASPGAECRCPLGMTLEPVPRAKWGTDRQLFALTLQEPTREAMRLLNEVLLRRADWMPAIAFQILPPRDAYYGLAYARPHGRDAIDWYPYRLPIAERNTALIH